MNSTALPSHNNVVLNSEKLSIVERRVRAYIACHHLPDGITKIVGGKRVTRADQRITVAMILFDAMMAATMAEVPAGGKLPYKGRRLFSREEIGALASAAKAPWKILGTDVSQGLVDLVKMGAVRKAGILYVLWTTT